MKKNVVFFFLLGGILSAQIPSRYHSNNDLTDLLKKISSQYSSLVTMHSLVTTTRGNDLWMVTIGNREADTKKAILVIGGIEPAHLSGSEYALRFIDRLVRSHEKTDSLKELLKSTTVYVIPRANPDASESYFTKPMAEQETGGAPYDDDRDGVTDEDGREDINRDGYITMMRVKDPRGEWIENPDDVRLMRKADAAKGEKGIYRLLTEGIDNDKDEEWNEDPVGGTDLNRNFTYNYRFFGPNSGIHQMSEPVTRAIADFVFDHPNIAVVFTFSTNDNLTAAWKNEPPRGETPHITSVLKEDEDYFEQVSKKFSEITSLKDAPKPVKGEGALSEWAYYHAGRWSFAVRPWWAGEMPKAKDSAAAKDSTKKIPGGKNEEKAGDPDVKILKWYDAVGMKEVFLPWKKFDHPDFPGREVEIGGVKPFALKNPPADSLPSFAVPFSDFILYLAHQLPSVGLSNQNVEKVGENVYRVSVDVVNNGYLPTNSAMGGKTRWIRNVRVTLDAGSGNTVSGGRTKQTLEPIKGSGGFQTVSWVVVGKGKIVVKAESPVSGTAELKIDLK